MVQSSLDFRNMELPTRLKGEKYWVPSDVKEVGDRLVIKAAYNKTVIAELKAMAGARWNPDNKSWSVLNNRRNWFQLAYMAGVDSYKWYDRPLLQHEFGPRRHLDKPELWIKGVKTPAEYNELTPYLHQQDMVLHGLTYHYGIWSAEMGTGKSLAAIYVMELAGLGNHDCLYVGPKSALASFQLQLKEWCAEVIPECITYEGLRKLVETWPKGKPAPKLVIFDESSRLKNPTSQRSQAAYHLAEAIRDEHGDNGFVILMSGSPAPKSPADWWWQAEIACPGFIKEGTIEKFKARLGLIVMKESFATGGSYPHLITWKDDEKKCEVCGEVKDHESHRAPTELELLCGKGEGWHEFRKSVNEVSYLYERLKGLTIVKFKKDCLELPEKRYRIIRCQPTQATLNAAKLILAGASTTIAGLTLLRELSDGFQYTDTAIGQVDCHRCKGAKLIEMPIPIVDQDEIDNAMAELMQRAGEDFGIDAEGMPIPEHLLLADKYRIEMVPCPGCGGIGTVTGYKTEAIQVPCPKEDVMKDILDSHEEDGRLVSYAGFQGSIDRLTDLSRKMSWNYIRVDGRGWHTDIPGMRSSVDMLTAFQKRQAEFPRLNFIGHPGSAGMGLTLTASSEIVFYSNDFNAESRIQAMDRIHRPGMDINKGALITDIFHLPSDEKVHQNLTKKMKLQDMSLGQFREAMANFSAENWTRRT